MKWLIQDSTSFAILDRNIKPLIKALDEEQVPYKCIGLVPFSHEITGLDESDSKENRIFYGSTLLAELVHEKYVQHSPGVFYEPNWWDQNNWIENRTDMLNQDCMTITVKMLRENWPDEPMFIRPKSVKVFSGHVIEPEEQEMWLEEYSEVKDNELIYMSYPINIDKEWRFFIVEGQVVTGSLYKWHGVLNMKEEIPKHIWEIAQQKASLWLPGNTIVMDLCQTRAGEIKVVEFNCFNCSGGYHSDWRKIVRRILDTYA